MEALAPQVGFEPTTARLTAECSTTELLRNNRKSDLCIILPGNVLLSQAVSRQLPSALESLTSVFGMGTGVTSPPSSPSKHALDKCYYKGIFFVVKHFLFLQN